MIIKDIDQGKDFDWGKTSKDYAKYRDIYPQELAAEAGMDITFFASKAEENFLVKHYCSIAQLQVKK